MCAKWEQQAGRQTGSLVKSEKKNPVECVNLIAVKAYAPHFAFNLSTFVLLIRGVC